MPRASPALWRRRRQPAPALVGIPLVAGARPPCQCDSRGPPRMSCRRMSCWLGLLWGMLGGRAHHYTSAPTRSWERLKHREDWWRSSSLSVWRFRMRSHESLWPHTLKGSVWLCFLDVPFSPFHNFAFPLSSFAPWFSLLSLLGPPPGVDLCVKTCANVCSSLAFQEFLMLFSSRSHIALDSLCKRFPVLQCSQRME